MIYCPSARRRDGLFHLSRESPQYCASSLDLCDGHRHPRHDNSGVGFPLIGLIGRIGEGRGHIVSTTPANR